MQRIRIHWRPALEQPIVPSPIAPHEAPAGRCFPVFQYSLTPLENSNKPRCNKTFIGSVAQQHVRRKAAIGPAIAGLIPLWSWNPRRFILAPCLDRRPYPDCRQHLPGASPGRLDGRGIQRPLSAQICVIRGFCPSIEAQQEGGGYSKWKMSSPPQCCLKYSATKRRWQ